MQTKNTLGQNAMNLRKEYLIFARSNLNLKDKQLVNGTRFIMEYK